MTLADLGLVMELAAGLPEAPHWPQSAYLTALDPAAPPRRIALVAVGSQNELKGFAIASLFAPQAELETIAVARASQRLGIGRLLFEALTAELRTARVGEVLLEVRASNQAALAFYRSLGFAQTGLRRAYYQDPVDDAILMQLKLR